ncbi:MAG: hypothetical protein ABEJ78_09560 [Haloferacaceae archaeon]
MKRRNLILGLGSLSAAGAAGVGTGAFSLGEVDRDATVAVASEDQAYLAMEPSPGPNGAYATTGGAGEIGLDFSGTGGQNGSGVNSEGEFYFDDVFRIENQGTQTVYVWANFSNGTQFDDSNLYLYPNGARQTRLNDGPNSVLTLAPGESAEIGVYIDTDSTSTTSDGSSGETLDVTIRADVDKPGSSGSVGPGGDEALVVDDDPDNGDFSSIQAAITNASSTTIIIEPGTYDESVTVDKSVTLRGPNAGTHGASSSRSSEATVKQSMEIAADGVTIDGLEINGAVGNGINMRRPVSDVTIRNTLISNVIDTGFPQSGGVDVAANGINAQLGQGAGEMLNLLIRDNKIIGMDISANNDSNDEVTATGIRLNQKDKNVEDPVIRGNVITGLRASNGGNGTVEARGFTFNAATATGADVVDDLILANNEISDLEAKEIMGIGLFENGNVSARPGPTNFEITENVFENLTGTAQTPAAIFVGGYEDLGNDHRVRRNNILSGAVARYAGNQTGFDYSQADALDTQNNYWGASSGPSGEDGVSGSGQPAVTLPDPTGPPRSKVLAADSGHRSNPFSGAGPNI